MPRYSYQLMLDDHGQPVLAHLYHAGGGKKPTDVVGTCPINFGDSFVLTEDCGCLKTGAKVEFRSTFIYNLWLYDDAENFSSAIAEFSSSRTYYTDTDDRRMYFTKYHFKIERAAVVENKDRRWHLVFNIDENRPMLVETYNHLGPTGDAKRLGRKRYPNTGETFVLDWKLGDIKSGSKITFEGVNEDRTLRLLSPEGQMSVSHTFQSRGNDEDGCGYFGPRFKGQPIIIADPD